MKIEAYEILASGGYPTVECKVSLDNGAFGIASVPYGASAGSHEATVLTDGDGGRYNGNGVLKAVNNILNEIAPKILEIDPEDQQKVDQTMIQLDGTPNKARLGGNAILAVSLAVARAVAAAKGLPLYKYIIEKYQTGIDLTKLPMPMVVVIEGGKHADDTTDLQEFCLLATGKGSVEENVRKCMEVYHKLKTILKNEKLSTNVGNEGAFAPSGIPTNESPMQFIEKAIVDAGYVPAVDISIAIDAAASEFYIREEKLYSLKLEGKKLTSDEMIAKMEAWAQKYPIRTVEDPLDEDDWDGWVKANEMYKKHNITLIGDDLTVTNIDRLKKAMDMGAITGILIKLNQIGTLTETVECCKLANQHGIISVTSHRGGGETNDTAMIDVAVAVGSKYVKVGPTRGERVSKYNRLMEIEREVGVK